MASDTRQRVQGDIMHVSQSTTCRVFAAVLNAIMANLDKFISWPSTQEEERIKTRFYQLTGIPGVIGCLDGTHVEIQAPSRSEHSFLNRKGWHSLNVFKESDFYRDLRLGRRRGVLLADSAYQAETFVLKPILSNERSDAETRYTNALCKGRVIIEDAIGALKNQFEILGGCLRWVQV
ncbi:hypothetical protein ANCCAN_03263 [Ancylostoma caninum]|uniref:Putative nuclease HARBI1 n=1 Tax=Ancylostoma caninum TaxID=29170 RepID=A0A368H5R2_ANCCA|nr:hypothetical protein ANCCAN_03263 [Ancylostoma caninum]